MRARLPDLRLIWWLATLDTIRSSWHRSSDRLIKASRPLLRRIHRHRGSARTVGRLRLCRAPVWSCPNTSCLRPRQSRNSPSHAPQVSRISAISLSTLQTTLSTSSSGIVVAENGYYQYRGRQPGRCLLPLQDAPFGRKGMPSIPVVLLDDCWHIPRGTAKLTIHCAPRRLKAEATVSARTW